MSKYNLDSAIELDMESEELVEIYEHVLAGIFQEDTDESNKALAFILKAIRLKEVKGPHKVLFFILQSLNDLGVAKINKDTFNSDTLSVILDNGLDKFVKKYSWDFESWIAKHDLDYDLDSVKGFTEFETFLFAETLRKFNELSSMNSNLTIYLQSLSDKLKEDATGQALVFASTVLTTGSKLGRDILQGTEDSLDMMRELQNYINQRFSLDTSEETRYAFTTLSSYEDAEKFQHNEFTKRAKRGFYETLYDCGFGSLDIQIMRGDIFAIIGDEGVGKTKLLVDQVYRALCEKQNVLLVCTETQKINMLYMLYARHINEKLGLEPSHVELLKFQDWIDQETDVEMKRRMESDFAECMSAIPSFFSEEMGRLTLVQSSKYSEFRDIVRTFSNQDGDIVAIDSISFLDKDDSKYRSDEKSNIDELMKDMDFATTEMGMTFIFTTHTSSEANKTLSRGKTNTGVRVGAGSGYVTKMATITILVSTNDELRPQEKFIFDAKKTRDRRNTVSQVIMLRNGNSNKYEFRKELQVTTELDDNLDESELY